MSTEQGQHYIGFNSIDNNVYHTQQHITEQAYTIALRYYYFNIDKKNF